MSSPQPLQHRAGFGRIRRRRVWVGLLLLLLVAMCVTGCVVWWDVGLDSRESTVNPLLSTRWPQSTVAMRAPGRLRVLFLGNSFTAFNGGQALILEALATSAKKTPKPVFDQVCVYGATLAQLWDHSQALPMIRQGNWDYVVLQDYSLAAIKYQHEMSVYSGMFSNEIRAAGARPVFFMTWARKDLPSTQGLIASTYASMAAVNHGVLSPAGLAWQAALHGRPTLALHMKDHRHPTPEGSYLNACVFYAVLFHQSPHGLTSRVVEGNNVYISLSQSDAVYLQDVAWKTVQETGAAAATQPTQLTAGSADHLIQ